MRCIKCGKEIAEGSRKCEHCGTPVRTKGAARGKKRNLTMVAVAAVLLMFGMLSLMSSGISAKVEIMGASLTLTVPVISASSLLGYIAAGGIVKFLLIMYVVLTVIAVAAAFLAVFMIITRRSAGVAAGLVSSVLSAVMSIVMVITILVVNGKYGNSALTVMPSVWLWLSVPANILSAIFLFIEKVDIV